MNVMLMADYWIAAGFVQAHAINGDYHKIVVRVHDVIKKR
jgi:hypothetical protein